MKNILKSIGFTSMRTKQMLIGAGTILAIVTIGVVINSSSSSKQYTPQSRTITINATPTKAATEEAHLSTTPTPTPKSLSSASVTPTKKPTATATPGGKVAGTTNASDKLVIDDIEPIPNGAIITNTDPCITVKYHKNTNATAVLMMWKVDSGNWTGYYPIYHPCVFYGLGVGNHSVSVALNDDLGNISAIMTRNFSIVDTKPPEFREFIGGAQEGSVIPYNYQCVGWVYHDEVTGNSGMNFRWKLDSNDWTGYSTAVTACVNFSNGQHTLQVQAKDINGNESGVTTTHFSVQGSGSPTATPTQGPTTPPANTPTPEAPSIPPTAVPVTESPTPTGE